MNYLFLILIDTNDIKKVAIFAINSTKCDWLTLSENVQRLENQTSETEEKVSEVGNINFLKLENQTSGGLENKPFEVGKINPNNTKKNDTEYSNPDLIVSEDTGSGLDEYNAYANIIRENMEIDILYQQYPYDKELLDGIYDLILETVLCKSGNVIIASNEYPLQLVKSKFLKLNSSHIQYVMDCLKETTSKVRNIKKYLLAALFNAPSTMKSYYQAEVNHDMPQFVVRAIQFKHIKKDEGMDMYNDYEESFYYDKLSSISSDVSGEAIGLGLGLGVGLISTIISGLLFLIARIDILSSSLLGLLFYLLTYRFEWNEPVYIIGVIAIVSVSMMLQHIFKVFRILYGIFTCVAVSLFVSVFIGYSTDSNMYKTMAICFVVTAVWTTISWKCIIRKQLHGLVSI